MTVVVSTGSGILCDFVWFPLPHVHSVSSIVGGGTEVSSIVDFEHGGRCSADRWDKSKSHGRVRTRMVEGCSDFTRAFNEGKASSRAKENPSSDRH